MVGIYMFVNKLNNKKYIGQSINIEKRKKEHIKRPSKYSKFDNHLSKLGIEAFDFLILEECKVSELDNREKYWIEYYNSIEEGYNLVKGGQSYRGSDNIRAKLTDKEVLEIISLLEQHTLNNKQIAQLYNVSNGTIDSINRCQHWKHLHNYISNIRQENLNKLDFPHSSFAGENNPTAKINSEIATQIINAIKSENFKSLAQTARDFNVSIDIVTDINRCRTWKHLHNYQKNIRDEARCALKGVDII